MQCGADVVDLPLVRLAAQLPGQLGALGQPGRTYGVSLGEQATRGVDHPAPTVGAGVFFHQPFAFALGAQAERLVGDQFVGAEAVVQFYDLHVVGAQAGFFVNLPGRALGHAHAGHAYGTALEVLGPIGGKRHCEYIDRAGVGVGLQVALGHDHRSCRTVAGRAGLQQG